MAGRVGIGQQRPFASTPAVGRWYADGSAFAFQWRPDWNLSGPAWYVIVPLWIPAAVTLATTAAAWRVDGIARRRAGGDGCKKCHYDRTGLAPGAVCPECGQVNAAA